MTRSVQDPSLASAVRTAEAAFGIVLDAPEVLRRGRATVISATSVDGSARRTVIIKKFETSHREHFVRERAGLAVLSNTPGLEGFVPPLLDADEVGLVLLIGHIVEQGSYLDLVFAGGGPAAEALVDTARRLGVLHGHARAGISAHRAQIPDPAGPGLALRNGVGSTLAFLQRALSNDATAGGEFAVGSELHSQLMEVARRVDEPTALSTITLGDMAPSNLVLGPHGPVFIDLEYCGVRHAFYDAMYWHCIYPVPAAIVDRMDEAYRSGLRAAGIRVTDDEFLMSMFRFMSHRLFWTLSWNAVPLLDHDRDVVPGVSTRETIRQYLREYNRFAAMVPRLEFPELAVVATRLEERLAELWPGTDATG